LNVHIQVQRQNREIAEIMSNERMRQLAERVKEKNLRDGQVRELQLHRARVLSSRGSDFWKDFVIALTDAIHQFKAAMENPAQWDDFSTSTSEFNKMEISKHESPYLNACLELDVNGACIRGFCKWAAIRPTSALTEKHILIDLKVDSENRVYGVLDGQPQSVADLASSVVELLLSEESGSSAKA
jgi:hypothetical protein